MVLERKDDFIKNNGLFLLLLLVLNILNGVIIKTNIFTSDFLGYFFIFLRTELFFGLYFFFSLDN